MKVCQKCQALFNPRYKINGEVHSLYKRKFCLNCSPFGYHNTTKLIDAAPKSTIDKLSDVEFEILVKSSISRTDIFHKLKLRKSGASFKILNRRLKKSNVDISHFRMGCLNGNNKLPDEVVYVENSPHKNIRDRVVSDNVLEYRCGKCKRDNIWNGEPLTLELDHINGNRYDNRKENLRWLCPNCHSQTSTFGTKKRS